MTTYRGSATATPGSLVTANAENVDFSPFGNIASTDVQSAIEELDSEKVAKAGDTMTGDLTVPNIITAGNVDGRDVSADGTKLDGIEALADVTDTANVTAAGALMDSEIDADLKTFALPANTTISTFGATLVDDADAATARTTLGLGSLAVQSTINNDDWSGADLSLTNGGTGSSTAQTAIDALTQVSGATNEYVLTKDTTSGSAEWKAATGGVTATTTSEGIVELATDAEVQTGTDTSRAITPSSLRGGAIICGTLTATTSGTSHDFTGIPSWVKRITIMFNGVSTDGTSNYLVQIGDSGGIETSGYSGDVVNQTGATGVTMGSGFLVTVGTGAAQTWVGVLTIYLMDEATNLWNGTSILTRVNATTAAYSAGRKALTGTLDRVRVTTAGGTDTFDSGNINIQYE